MKHFIPIYLLILVVALSGCSWAKKKTAAASQPVSVTKAPKAPKAPKAVASSAKSKTIITPDISLVAKVVSVRHAERYVVLNFPTGELPKLQQTLFLYRDGLKVAELKITDSKSHVDYNNNFIVADIVSGKAQVGDTVRDQ